MEDTPIPNLDMHRLIIRRKMTALKESLKNTEKLLDDALLSLESVTLRSEEDDEEDEEEAKEKAKKQVKPEDAPNPNADRKWSVTSIYF